MYLPSLPANNKFRILIVEDDPAIAKLAALPLKGSGFSIFTARDGAEALIQLPQVNPHLILTDIKMPRMTGPELIMRVRRASIVPIVVFTSYDTEEAQVKALRIGADDIIAKPFTPQLLIMRIATTLRRVYRYNQPQAAPPKSPVLSKEAAHSDALPRGFVRCDSCQYIGPAWKFEKKDREGNISTQCPNCHSKTMTFSLG